MVFANLQTHEKDAFFTLLDEYFESRPTLFSGVSEVEATPGDARAAAAGAVGRAIAANPVAAANFGKRVLSSASNTTNARSPSGTDTTSNQDISHAVGRVAAASLALQNRNREPSPGPPPMPSRNDSSSGVPPAAPPRRSLSQTSTTPASGLVNRQGIGKVDTTSKMNALVSSFSSKKPTPSVAPPAPSAFSGKKNTFAPPPVRRMASDSSSATGAPPTPPFRKIAPPPEPEPEEEEEEEDVGEWADVLYDYSSNVRSLCILSFRSQC
jgi:abl interactor 2